MEGADVRPRPFLRIHECVPVLDVVPPSVFEGGIGDHYVPLTVIEANRRRKGKPFFDYPAFGGFYEDVVDEQFVEMERRGKAPVQGVFRVDDRHPVVSAEDHFTLGEQGAGVVVELQASQPVVGAVGTDGSAVGAVPEKSVVAAYPDVPVPVGDDVAHVPARNVPHPGVSLVVGIHQEGSGAPGADPDVTPVVFSD